MRRRNSLYKYCVCTSVLVYIYYYCGIRDYVLSKSYDEEFDYPLNIDIRPVVNEVLSGKNPSVEPINIYPYNFLTNSETCSKLDKLDLFIVVKSAMYNLDKRNAIRETYGKENSVPGKTIKMLFFIGIDEPASLTQKRVDQEIQDYKDIIQTDFIDSYQNNTIKIMMSFKWLYQHCSTADFYLFTDDDMYISVKNLLDYVDDNPTNDSANVKGYRSSKKGSERDSILFMGFIFTNSVPQRFRSNKWFVPVEEYPWDKYPPYVSGGAFVISNRSMNLLYIGSLFVKHFRFDDAYLGVVAKKVGIKPTHCSQFYFYKKKHYSISGYRDVIASHGYDDPHELKRVWNEQNAR